MAEWIDGFWQSHDGLRLHFRDYPGDGERPPILCLPGLTRNARDFEGVADRLAGRWRVICAELRGRGSSEHARDSMTYVPPVYFQDVEALIQSLGIDRLILFGTSLGGLITVLLAQQNRDRIAGALLNDIGPVIEESGLDTIRSYVGRARDWPTWLHAARYFAEAQHNRYPDWEIDQWLVYAKRLCKLSGNGRIVLDYDMRIAEPFKQDGGESEGIDLWPAFRSLSGRPSLIVHGAISDLLSRSTVDQMTAEIEGMESVTVPRVGHAPTLEEPEAVAGIDRLLGRIEQAALR